jgi:hypothetical protein
VESAHCHKWYEGSCEASKMIHMMGPQVPNTA